MVAYTGANTEEGPSVYFYDLLTRQTFAKVGGAELLIDCYLNEQSKPQILYL